MHTGSYQGHSPKINLTEISGDGKLNVYCTLFLQCPQMLMNVLLATTTVMTMPLARTLMEVIFVHVIKHLLEMVRVAKVSLLKTESFSRNLHHLIEPK